MDKNIFPNQSIKPISTKINSKGNLEIANCDLVELAKKYQTPLYVETCGIQLKTYLVDI